MTKTSRIQNRFASQGAVAQNGGNLPLYRCNACQSEVVWAESKKTGSRYLCNVRVGYHDNRYYIGADVHPRNCGDLHTEALAEQSRKAQEQDRTRGYIKQIQAARKAGDMELALRLTDEMYEEN